MPKLRRFLLIALAGTGMLLGARGCGGVTDDRIEARNRTTKATCDRFAACGLIGTDAGDTYATYDSCTITWMKNWDDAWPMSACQGRINQMELGECLSAIGGTDCNLGDLVLTLLKCPQTMICTAGPPPDGG